MELVFTPGNLVPHGILNDGELFFDSQRQRLLIKLDDRVSIAVQDELNQFASFIFFTSDMVYAAELTRSWSRLQCLE